MNIERFKTDISEPVFEREKPKTLPEFLSQLQEKLDGGTEFLEGSIAKKIIGDMLGLGPRNRDKVYKNIRSAKVLGFKTTFRDGQTKLWLSKDGFVALGAIYFMADSMYADLDIKIDNWGQIYVEAQKGLIENSQPEVANLIHIPSQQPKKPIENTQKPASGYQPDDETLRIAAAYTPDLIKTILGEIPGKWLDSLEAFGKVPYNIIQLTTFLHAPFNRRSEINDSDEYIWLSPVIKFEPLLKWCLMVMEKYDLPDLRMLYIAIKKHQEQNPLYP